MALVSTVQIMPSSHSSVLLHIWRNSGKKKETAVRFQISSALESFRRCNGFLGRGLNWCCKWIINILLLFRYWKLRNQMHLWIGLVTLKPLLNFARLRYKPNKLRKFYLANDFDFQNKILHIEMKKKEKKEPAKPTKKSWRLEIKFTRNHYITRSIICWASCSGTFNMVVDFVE